MFLITTKDASKLAELIESKSVYRDAEYDFTVSVDKMSATYSDTVSQLIRGLSYRNSFIICHTTANDKYTYYVVDTDTNKSSYLAETHKLISEENFAQYKDKFLAAIRYAVVNRNTHEKSKTKQNKA